MHRPRRLICTDKTRHVMKKEDVEKEISALLGRRVNVTSQISKGRSYARCIIGEWQYEGEAQSIDFAYRALLMKIRQEHASGMLV